MQGQTVGKEFTRPFDDGKQPNSRHLGGYNGGRPSDNNFIQYTWLKHAFRSTIWHVGVLLRISRLPRCNQGIPTTFLQPVFMKVPPGCNDPKRPMPWTPLAGWRYEGHVATSTLSCHFVNYVVNYVQLCINSIQFHFPSKVSGGSKHAVC